jgi:hypothetical protein
MSRAFGDGQYKGDAKRSAIEQKLIALPDVTRIVANEGDILLLFSDGVNEQGFSEQAVGCFVNRNRAEALSDPVSLWFCSILSLPHSISPPTCSFFVLQLKTARRVVDAAFSTSSRDNITAMVVSFTNGVDYPHKKEYTPGRTSAFEHKHFSEPFEREAKRHGINTAEELEAFKKRAEANYEARRNNFERPDYNRFNKSQNPKDPYPKTFHPDVSVLVPDPQSPGYADLKSLTDSHESKDYEMIETVRYASNGGFEVIRQVVPKSQKKDPPSSSPPTLNNKKQAPNNPTSKPEALVSAVASKRSPQKLKLESSPKSTVPKSRRFSSSSSSFLSSSSSSIPRSSAFSSFSRRFSSSSLLRAKSSTSSTSTSPSSRFASSFSPSSLLTPPSSTLFSRRFFGSGVSASCRVFLSKAFTHWTRLAHR